MDLENMDSIPEQMADKSMFRLVRALYHQSYLDERPRVDLMARDGTCWRGTWVAVLEEA